MAGALAKTPGGIGYMDLTHALAEPNLAYGWVLNRSGVYVNPTLESVREAARVARIPSNLQFTLTDPEGEKSYPISGTTWAVFDARFPDETKRRAVIGFLDWATHDGQKIAPRVNYAPLPENLVLMVEATLQRKRQEKR
jgi:phosphate transport system substrate-binding protein